jgi:hypothetical protein
MNHEPSNVIRESLEEASAVIKKYHKSSKCHQMSLAVNIKPSNVIEETAERLSNVHTKGHAKGHYRT